jgi:AcrR family transcriptional regulator
VTSPSQRLKSRKTPVQARSVETRARILDAAARVFSRHGYSAGTTNRIAAEAGMSVGSVYQYFPNKDAMLMELVRRHIAEGTAAIRDRLSAGGLPDGPPERRGADGPPERRGADRLRARLGILVDAVIANHTDDPRLHQVLFEEAPRPPALLRELHELEEDLIARTAALLADEPAVRVADPALAARIVVTTVESLVHRIVATRRRTVDLEAFRTELVTMLARYLTG